MTEAVPSGSYSTDKYVPFPQQQHFDSTHISTAQREASQPRTAHSVPPLPLLWGLHSASPALVGSPHQTHTRSIADLLSTAR